MATIELDQVDKHYGSYHALRNISFEIADGEFLVLVGPSGCGKSTLLRSLAGLEEITSGTIKLGGNRVDNIAARDRDVAMVFQNYALYPHMTVRENMAFALKLRGETLTSRNAKVDKAAEMLRLTAYLDRYPKALSGGQRQRVAMGRAMVRSPKAFFFDEPLSNLDAALRVDMRSEIKALHQRLGATSVYVTHDQIEAMTMADRIVVLRDGKVEQIGAPLELYDKPANTFVAGFIGSPAMNMLPATIDVSLKTARLADGLALPLPSGTRAKSGQEVIYGIRPDQWSLSKGDTGVPAIVELIEPTGAEILVAAQLAGKRVLCAFRERHAIKPGDQIRLKVDPVAAHVFDRQTGQRIAP
ncbi:sugar ABC transporter ATP-binding protein [Mesorhizobium sp. Root554]|uniref:ABC transporter ATP-binding protein n=1 Tax=unclassified Mesorhizobium TaxID=325217 RepID=UPI0006F5035B|nr:MULTISPECIES: sn-glycerol-3-phosphate ABC transporter ATP-binding protein UgpC [unclassified Mesorhizobium]KQZ14733.1 sugar ABC transporter ATP-binding protein [Mesorhizobium sp. Root1471]KQZ37240.1 sugar ABC transporter ATP-binding protein [Mesorhizobium sp. Root554]